MPIRGSCLCGAVSYEITGSFKTVGHCHCPMCRKSNGAAFATWGIIDGDQFRWAAGEEWVQGYQSSPDMVRCFCKNCGSPLASSHGGAVTEVVVATLDDDPGMVPTEHIFVGCRASWYEITDGLRQYETWPPGFEA